MKWLRAPYRALDIIHETTFANNAISPKQLFNMYTQTEFDQFGILYILLLHCLILHIVSQRGKQVQTFLIIFSER